MNANSVGKLFTMNGDDLWRCVSYCGEPTIKFQNLETGELKGGAVGCLNFEKFKQIEEDEMQITCAAEKLKLECMKIFGSRWNDDIALHFARTAIRAAKSL